MPFSCFNTENIDAITNFEIFINFHKENVRQGKDLFSLAWNGAVQLTFLIPGHATCFYSDDKAFQL